MPTPSEQPGSCPGVDRADPGIHRKGEACDPTGAPGTQAPAGEAVGSPRVLETAPRDRRSLFGNYTSEPAAAREFSGEAVEPVEPVERGTVEVALARCFLHQFLARAFEYPCAESWNWLSSQATREAGRAAVTLLRESPESPLARSYEAVVRELGPEALPAYHDDYAAAIGHAARGSSPINEIEYGELKADPLLQPHRLADLGAFYRAFGLELRAEGGERHDHLSVELEFMTVLVGQEAHALAQGLPDEVLAINRRAQRLFLREHLGRWSPAFARRLRAAVGEGGLGRMAEWLLAFVEAEGRRLGVATGAEDVLLRPADEGAALCDSCGLTQRLPGGEPTPETE